SNSQGICTATGTPAQSSTTTTLSSSVLQAKFRQRVTFTAAVSSNGLPVGTGSVTFKEGSKMLASIAVDSQGHAAFSTAQLTIGMHVIMASYTGSGTFLASNSAVLNQYRSPKPH